MTAAHCLSPPRDLPDKGDGFQLKCARFILQQRQDRTTRKLSASAVMYGTHAWVHPNWNPLVETSVDLALILVAQELPSSATITSDHVLALRSLPEPGARVEAAGSVCGYPALPPGAEPRKRWMWTSKVTVPKAAYARLPCMAIQGRSGPGFSGSPLSVLHEGRTFVIGVHVGAFKEADALTDHELKAVLFTDDILKDVYDAAEPYLPKRAKETFGFK